MLTQVRKVNEALGWGANTILISRSTSLIIELEIVRRYRKWS